MLASFNYTAGFAGLSRSNAVLRPLPSLALPAFIANQCWPVLLDAGGLRDIEVEALAKMLASSTSILGVKQYRCNWLDKAASRVC